MVTPSTTAGTRSLTTLRVDALSSVGMALGRIDRFRSALVLKMHDTPTYGSSIAGLAGIDKRKELREVRLPCTAQTEFLREATRRAAYDLVIASFELHHVDPHEERFVAEEIGKVLRPGGAFIVADYTLPDADPADFGPLATSANERTNIDAYGGIERWYRAHAGWTVDRLKRLACDAGKAHVLARPIPGHAGLAVASDDPMVAVEAGQALRQFARFV